METTLELNPRKLALTNALVWAVINIAIFLVSYYVMPDMMGSMALGVVQALIGIGLAVYFCFDLRKKVGGYWTFKQALGSIFLMFFGQAVIVFLFVIIFAKIEPEYVQKMKDITSANITSLMERMGTSQDKIDEALAKSEAGIGEQFNPGPLQLIKSICLVALMYFIGALIFAAIFKKDPPVFVPAEE